MTHTTVPGWKRGSWFRQNVPPIATGLCIAWYLMFPVLSKQSEPDVGTILIGTPTQVWSSSVASPEAQAPLKSKSFLIPFSLVIWNISLSFVMQLTVENKGHTDPRREKSALLSTSFFVCKKRCYWKKMRKMELMTGGTEQGIAWPRVLKYSRCFKITGLRVGKTWDESSFCTISFVTLGSYLTSLSLSFLLCR